MMRFPPEHAEITMKEKMAEMERKGRERNLTGDFDSSHPMLRIAIFMIIMLLVIVAIVGATVFHFW